MRSRVMVFFLIALAAPTLLCDPITARGDGPAPLSLTTTPVRFWLLVCSLAVLFFVVLLTAVRLPALAYWSILLGIVGATATAGLLWPDLLVLAAYGCQWERHPGEQHQRLEACQRVGRRVRVNRRDRTIMTGVEGLEHVESLRAAHLADDEPIRSHA